MTQVIETDGSERARFDDRQRREAKHFGNVVRPYEYQQVCVWPATTLGDGTGKQFEEWVKEAFEVRVKFMEVVETTADSTGPGGRHDLMFCVHDDDVAKFAVARLLKGIRWIEDAVSEVNGGNTVYPERVMLYKTWEA